MRVSSIYIISTFILYLYTDMKRSILLLFAFIFLAVSCRSTEPVSLTLTSILTSKNQWMVTEAKFGNEDARPGQYSRFRVEFKADGTYKITNPDGAPTFNRNNPASIGTWKETSPERGIMMDNLMLIRETSNTLNPSRVIFEWNVTIPGKQTTLYRFVLTPA
jgi:hypothetical protein